MNAYQDLPQILCSYLFFSVPVGLLAIFAGFSHRSTTTLVLSTFCILSGLFVLVLFGLSELFYIWPSLLPAALAPITLGGTALAILHYYRDRPPLKLFQISVPMALYLTLVIACIAGLAKLSDRLYYIERDFCLAYLQHIPGIENAVALGNDNADVFRVYAVEFSLVDRPETRVRLRAQVAYYVDSTELYFDPPTILQIGDWMPGLTVTGTSYDANGVASPAPPLDIIGAELTAGGPLYDLIPLDLDTVEEVVAHYDELAAALEKWPRRDSPGSVTDQNGRTIGYWVTDDPNALPWR